PASLDAAAPGAPLLYEGSPSNVCVDTRAGDSSAADATFSRAAHVVRLETWVQRVTGVPLEPRAAGGGLEASAPPPPPPPPGGGGERGGGGDRARAACGWGWATSAPAPARAASRRGRCAWSRAMSGATSARAIAAIRSSRWSPGRPVESAGP